MIMLIIGYLAVLAALLIVLGIRPNAPSHSQFELQRRSKKGDKKADIYLRQQKFLYDIISLQRVLASLLLVILTVISVNLFHWTIGLVSSMIIALEIGAVAQISRHFKMFLLDVPIDVWYHC